MTKKLLMLAVAIALGVSACGDDNSVPTNRPANYFDPGQPGYNQPGGPGYRAPAQQSRPRPAPKAPAPKSRK